MFQEHRGLTEWAIDIEWQARDRLAFVDITVRKRLFSLQLKLLIAHDHLVFLRASTP
jgi:hypothetical protein